MKTHSKNSGLTLNVSTTQRAILFLQFPIWLTLTFPQQTMASLSLLFNQFSPIPNTHTWQTYSFGYTELNQGTLYCRHTAKEVNEQQCCWCDTILVIPGRSWSVAHAFDVNPVHGCATNANTKLHSVLLWSLKPCGHFSQLIRLCACACLCRCLRGVCSSFFCVMSVNTVLLKKHVSERMSATVQQHNMCSVWECEFVYRIAAVKVWRNKLWQTLSGAW